MAGYMFNDLMWCRQEEDSGRSFLVLRNKELKKLKHNASHITQPTTVLFCYLHQQQAAVFSETLYKLFSSTGQLKSLTFIQHIMFSFMYLQ